MIIEERDLLISASLYLGNSVGDYMLEWIIRLMNLMGYFAIVLLMFIENIFPPIPSELIMPLAGFIAVQGRFSLVGIIMAGTIGSVLGALPLYYLGKIIGEERLKPWIKKYGKWLTISCHDIDKAKKWFSQHGGAAVFICRLVPGIRSLISIPAGMGKMNLWLFLLYTTMGSALWSGLLGWGGYMLGSRYSEVEKYLGTASYLVLGAIVALYVTRVVRLHQKEATP